MPKTGKDTKKSSDAKTRSKPAAQKAQQAAKGPESGMGSFIAAIAVIVVLIVIGYALFYYILPRYFPSFLSGVPFSTFKANFGSATRVAVVATYTNNSQWLSNVNCAINIISNGIAPHRNVTTIDFFIVNATNCTYSPIGYPINYTVEPIAQCIKVANSEPSIFLNYSAVNRTTITAYHMYVSGNVAYMRMCPVAVDIS